MSFWESCKLDTKYQKVYAWVFGFSLIYISAILLANVQYGDDIGRSIYGYAWNHNGRLLQSFISYILNGNNVLMDIAPWSQILGVACFDYGLVCWVRKNMPEGSVIKSSIVASFAYVNLFLLDILVFRYDAIGIMLGMGIIFFLFSLPENGTVWKRSIISAFVVLTALYIYQALIGAYLALIVMEIFFEIQIGKFNFTIINKILGRFIGIIIGAILWKVSFAVFCNALSAYTQDHMQIVNFISLSGIKIIYSNILKYGYLFKGYFQTIGWMALLVSMVMGVGQICVAYNIWCSKMQGKSREMRILAILFVMLMPMLLLFATIAPLVVLKNPVFSTRVLISFSVFTLFQGYIIYTCSKNWNKVMAISIMALAVTLSHASYFGNLISCQARFSDNVACIMVQDINDIEKQYGRKFQKISKPVENDIPCRELMLAQKSKLIYCKEVYSFLASSNWIDSYLNHYRVGQMKAVYDRKQDVEAMKFIQPARSNEFYRMYVVDDKIVVDFEKR